MSEPTPVTPTRIIPAGQQIPTAPPLPAAPHGTEDVPPWRTTAPPPRRGGAPPPHEPPAPPPPPHGAGAEQRVVVEVWYPPTEPAPEPEQHEAPRWSMAWLWRHAHPWKTALGGALALIPMPWTGYSLATTWAYTVHQARDFGWAWGYGLAGAALALAVLADSRRARIVTRLALVTAAAGVLGAIDPYDPITILTGVQR